MYVMEKDWGSQSCFPTRLDPFQRPLQGFTSEGDKTAPVWKGPGLREKFSFSFHCRNTE